MAVKLEHLEAHVDALAVKLVARTYFPLLSLKSAQQQRQRELEGRGGDAELDPTSAADERAGRYRAFADAVAALQSQ